jgi:hypothetical protein
MKGIMCEWILGCLLGTPAGAPEATPVVNPTELQFRAILYPVYQQHDEQALIDALVTEQLAASSADALRYARLAAVSTAFAIDAHGVGWAAAARLRATPLSASDAARVALLCARDAYRRQDWTTLQQELLHLDSARAALTEDAAPPPAIGAEIALLHAELATAQHDYTHAEVLIDAIPERASGRAFALFNLGVALRNSGLPTRSEQVLGRLAALPVYDTAALDLKQRALVALSLLNQQRTASATAESLLRQIPAQSRYHDAALVAYAKLAMDHGDYEVGARVWSALLAESIWSNAGKAAQVGYPVCLENIGKARVALTQYRLAEANFTQRSATLSTLAEHLQDTAWNRQLLRALTRLPYEPLASDPTLQTWRNGLGSDDWFAWLTNPDVQRLLQELRELDGMARWLQSNGAASAEAPALAQRRRQLGERVARLVAEHEQRLAASLTAIVSNEAASAERQLRLIRVGIARATDRVAEQATP